MVNNTYSGEIMRILITGASGFIGGHLAKYFLSLDNEVVSIRHDIKPVDTSKLLGIDDKITWTHGDILNARFVERVIADYEVNAIIHAAALPIVRVATTRTQVPIFETNIIGTCNVLEAAKQQHLAGYEIKFLYVSTDKVYGDAGPNPYHENLPLNGLAPYEASKASADLITRGYFHTFGLKACVARTCNVFGAADLNSRLIPNTIKRCLQSKPPIVYKGITYVREFIHIKDVCEAYKLLLDNIDKTAGQAYNVGSGHHTNQEQMIAKILQYFPGLKPEYQDPPDYTMIEIPYQRLDTTKIYREFGWKAKVSLDEGLKEVIDWWKAHKELRA
ncbi:dTDP-glucose 4,6-dehydratase [subsurface metagenome]